MKRVRPKGVSPKRSYKKGEPSSDGDLVLPTARSTVSNRLRDFSILLFGEKKIGKTDLTAQFPDTIHLMTEPGGKAQAIYQVSVRTWHNYLTYIKLLKTDRRFPTVSVDTIDLLYQRCFEYMMRKLGIDHPSDESYGKGWNAIRQEFTRGIADLLSLDKGVILVSHATEKEIKTRGGGTYDKIMPTLAGQGRDIVEGMVDLWFYYGYSGDDRVLTITGNDHIGAGHRLKANFRYPDGSPIHEVPMGHSAEEAYANLITAFNNKLPGTSHEEPTKAKAFKVKKR